MHITTLGDNALVIELGNSIEECTHHRVQEAVRLLENRPLAGVVEIVPAFTTVTVFYDPVALAQQGSGWETLVDRLTRELRFRLRDLPEIVEATPGPIREIPICYGGEFGPDLEEVARRTGTDVSEVIRLHTGTTFLVYVIGFSPGFPYLGGLPEVLALPRRATPRTIVPAGSVGIVNRQSCIYPNPTPGGWHLIGRTPLRLFRAEQSPPSFLRAGDRVRFRAISPDQFQDGEVSQ